MTENSPSGSTAGPGAHDRAFLEKGRLMIQRSTSTARHVLYPRIAAPGSGAIALLAEASLAGGARQLEARDIAPGRGNGGMLASRVTAPLGAEAAP